MNAPRLSAVDTVVMASSASLFALGCFNVASNVQAVNDDNTPHDYGYGNLAPPLQAGDDDYVLNDYPHFVPTRGTVEGTEPGSRLIDSKIIWDTTDECNPNSRLYNFCSGKSSIFEHEIWLNNYQDNPGKYQWAMRNTDLWADEVPEDFFYLDTPLGDPEGEFSITFGTTHATYLEANKWYHVMILSDPGYDGPNYFKLRFEVGNKGKLCKWGICIPQCLLGDATCMPKGDDSCTILDWLHPWFKAAFPGKLEWSFYRGTCLVPSPPD